MIIKLVKKTIILFLCFVGISQSYGNFLQGNNFNNEEIIESNIVGPTSSSIDTKKNNNLSFRVSQGIGFLGLIPTDLCPATFGLSKKAPKEGKPNPNDFMPENAKPIPSMITYSLSSLAFIKYFLQTFLLSQKLKKL